MEIKSTPICLNDITEIISAQPRLSVDSIYPALVISGVFELQHEGQIFDSFDVRFEVPLNYPAAEPKIYETGRRIPNSSDRHVNPLGDCCVGVFEVWRLADKHATLARYINGPVRDYFLSQVYFEKHNTWPFGQLSHGAVGMVESAAILFGVPAKSDVVLRYAEALTKRPKGHHMCPCNSGVIIRKCHRQQLFTLGNQFNANALQALMSRLSDNIKRRQKPRSAVAFRLRTRVSRSLKSL